VAMRNHDSQCGQQTVLLGCRMDFHQFEQTEQEAPGFGMDRPEQRQIVIVVTGGYGFTALGQYLDTALFSQKRPDLMSRSGIGLSVSCGLKYLPEHAYQCLFHLSILILEIFEFLLGFCLGPADAVQQHLDQFITTLGVGLADQAEQQGVPLATLGNVEKLAHFEGGGFGGELAELCMGYAFQKWGWIDQAIQPSKPIRPQPDRSGAQASA
jgi:hypothetical protein